MSDCCGFWHLMRTDPAFVSGQAINVVFLMAVGFFMWKGYPRPNKERRKEPAQPTREVGSNG